MSDTIWFLRGYSNLFHAFNDIKDMDKNNDFSILCTHVNKNFAGFESSDFFEIEPEFNNEYDFIEYCKSMIIKYDIKLIIPTHKQKWLAANKEQLEDLGATVITCVSADLFNTINNKAKLYDYINNISNSPILIPTFQVVNDRKDFLNAYYDLSKLNIELCLKPSVGVYGNGYQYLSPNNPDLIKMLDKCKLSQKKYLSIIKQPETEIILMEYLPGTERSIDCVAVEGKLINGVIRVKCKDSSYQIIEQNVKLMKQVEWLCSNLKLNGMFNIQFRDNFYGQHYLLEINPRLAGGSATATKVGFNIPYITACLFLNKPYSNLININYGARVYSLPTPLIVLKGKSL